MDVAGDLSQDPLSYVEMNYDDGYSLSPEELDTVHLDGARLRFNQLRSAIPVLDQLATDQGVDELKDLEQVARLLFAHTVYKSYPLMYLDRGRYDKLTSWLDQLTSVDLSGLDLDGVDSIDAWIDRLDRDTDLRILHTFGTTGKLSFIPRNADGWDKAIRLTGHTLRDWHGAATGPDLLHDHLPVIGPAYRYGASAAHRGIGKYVELFAGSEENSLFLHPGQRFSADIATFAGRARAAEARGEQGALELPDSLVRRREEFAELERHRGEHMERFLTDARERFGDGDVFLFAVWPILFEWAQEGLASGYKGIFGPDSLLVSGGGNKGTALPENFREVIAEFLGFDNFFEFYGMSELMPSCPRCQEGNYHIPPVLVPFVLDLEDGSLLPRVDGQHGRFAVLDLMPTTYWGGFVTGDEVTMSGWEQSCACGRRGPYVDGAIRRVSDGTGQDDKINCSGAPEAHDHALELLTSMA